MIMGVKTRSEVDARARGLKRLVHRAFEIWFTKA